MKSFLMLMLAASSVFALVATLIALRLHIKVERIRPGFNHHMRKQAIQQRRNR